MSPKTKYRPYIYRLIIVMVISTIAVAIFNEVTYNFQRESYDRNPRQIELVIPPGTAERVAAGEKEPTIPDQLVFVKGDVLVVRNEDRVSHQIGPVWVPPGATGSLTMAEANDLAYSCSFTPSRYLSVDVRQPTTWGVRLSALLLAAPTVGVLIFLYSLILLPVEGKKKAAATVQPQEGAQ